MRAPARIDTEVRAIAPVAGMPPNRDAPIEATPWPTSSRSGSKAPVSAIDPATRAESSDSIAASAATVAAAGSSTPSISGSIAGRDGAGNEAGIVPMVASGVGSSQASTATTAIPISDPGIEGWILGASTITAATTRTAPSAHARWARSARASDCTAATRAFELSSPGAAGVAEVICGTCCRKMMQAMPRVNPSITGQGMIETTFPSRSRPVTVTISPASRVTAAIAPTP